jgi:hypothetical protein
LTASGPPAQSARMPIRYPRPRSSLTGTVRSLRHLIDLADDLQGGVDLAALHQPFDTATPSGRLFFHLLASDPTTPLATSTSGPVAAHGKR